MEAEGFEIDVVFV